MTTGKYKGREPARAGGKSVKRIIADHCGDEHDIWLTSLRYRQATLREVADLDPCKKVLVA